MRKTLLTLIGLALLAGGALAGTVTGIVVDSTGAPVDEAIVVIHPTMNGGGHGGGRHGGRHGGGDRYMERVETGEDGTFLFEDVPEGEYIVNGMKYLMGRDFEEIEVPEEGTVEVELQLEGCPGGDDPGRGGRHGRHGRDRRPHRPGGPIGI